MFEEIIVSVIVPAYNHEKFVEQCLLSIVSQKTNFNFEIVVGDDCSTDRTREKIIQISNQYPGKFNLFLYDKNQGPPESPGKNNTICLKLAARGKYLAYCESDDFWIDDYKLQKQVDFMEANPDISACFGSGYAVNADDNSRYVLYPSDKKQIRFKSEDMVSYNHVVTLTVMHRNGPYANCHPREYIESPIGDWVFWNYMALSGDIMFLNEMFGGHIEHSGGIYTGISIIRRMEKIQQTRLLINSLTKGVYKKKIYEDIYRDLYKNYIQYAATDKEIRHFIRKQLIRFSFYNSYIRGKFFQDFVFPMIKSRIKIFR